MNRAMVMRTILGCIVLGTANTASVAQFRLDIDRLADDIYPSVSAPSEEQVTVHLGGPENNMLQNVQNWVFGRHGNERTAREHLKQRLNAEIEELDGRCELTLAQEKKLRLAAAGDVALYFALVDQIVATCKTANRNDINRLWAAARPLQNRLEGEFFDSKSRFQLVAQRLFQNEQQTRFKQLGQRRREFFYSAQVKAVIAELESLVPLLASERDQVLQLMFSIAAPRCPLPRVREYVEFQLSENRERLAEILPEVKFTALLPTLARGAAFEPRLREEGIVR